MFSLDQAQRLRGGNVVDRDGEKIGSLEGIYLDHDTERPSGRR